MSKLQELLDEKWAIKSTTTASEKKTLNWLRGIFKSGYHNGISEFISLIPGKDDSGREGCKYGDTDYDSLSVAHGYNRAIQDILDNYEKFTKSLKSTNNG